jgi:adenylate cyclase, class 2
MKNIEIKFQISSPEKISSFLSSRPDTLYLWTREQTDIYFQTNTGRLKLRLQGDSDAQLIFYQRADDANARESEYYIHNTADGENLRSILEKSLGVNTIVRKIRSLYMFRNVRIHLDDVHGLGHFLEFESVIDYTTSQTSAEKNLQELLSFFSQFELNPVTKSYGDLEK